LAFDEALVGSMTAPNHEKPCIPRLSSSATLPSKPATAALPAFRAANRAAINSVKRARRNDFMDRMLVVVFDKESKAYEGQQALLQLDDEGSISVYAYAVAAKGGDGKATVKQGDDSGPLGTLLGTSLGSLIGLLGGPAGVAVGAAAGMMGGATADLDNARIGADFIDDVNAELRPNRVALVAEIEEEWATPVDTRMEALGGTVFRRALSEVSRTANKEEADAMKADLAQLKAEHSKARAERKAKLQEKIIQLDSKIQTWSQKDKDRTDAAERQVKAKLQVLKEKATGQRAKVS
jgi:uncharacterized membrane protein